MQTPAEKIDGKPSLRASVTGEIVMDQVEVGEDTLLPNVSGLKGLFGCLDRVQFNRPLACSTKD